MVSSWLVMLAFFVIVFGDVMRKQIEIQGRAGSSGPCYEIMLSYKGSTRSFGELWLACEVMAVFGVIQKQIKSQRQADTMGVIQKAYRIQGRGRMTECIL